MADVPSNWSTPAAVANGLTTELNGLAIDGITALGSVEIDNTGADQYVDLEAVMATANFPAGGYLAIWFVRALDGSTYENINGANSAVLARPADVIIPAPTINGPWRQVVGPRTLPNGKFKMQLQNKTGVQLNGTNNFIRYRTYNDVIAQ